MPQTSILTDYAAGLPGEVAYPNLPQVTLSKACNESAGIPFGCITCADSNDDVNVRLPAAAGDITGGYDVGVALRHEELPYSATGYALKQDLKVGRKGYFRVLLETGSTATANGQVHVRHTANGGNTQKGICRGSADGANTAILPNARFHKSSTGGSAIIEVW